VTISVQRTSERGGPLLTRRLVTQGFGELVAGPSGALIHLEVAVVTMEALRRAVDAGLTHADPDVKSAATALRELGCAKESAILRLLRATAPQDDTPR
jgi:hypothetical protein